MKKVFYYCAGIISTVTGLAFLYYCFNPSKIESAAFIIMLFFESIISGVIFIILEPRPRKTPEQIRRDDKIQGQGVITLFLIMVAVMILLMFSSCRTSGYGCKGKESWGKMTKRINRGY